AYHLVAESQTLYRTRRHVLDQDVGFRDQFPQERLAAFRFEIAGEAALVRVQENEIVRIDARDLAVAGSPPIAFSRFFHLDDIRSQPSERLGARRACFELRQIEYPNTGERGARNRSRSGSVVCGVRG